MLGALEDASVRAVEVGVWVGGKPFEAEVPELVGTIWAWWEERGRSAMTLVDGREDVVGERGLPAVLGRVVGAGSWTEEPESGRERWWEGWSPAAAMREGRRGWGCCDDVGGCHDEGSSAGGPGADLGGGGWS